MKYKIKIHGDNDTFDWVRRNCYRYCVRTCFCNNRNSSCTDHDNPANSKRRGYHDNYRLQIGDNVKNLVILIPNERHHGPGEDNEARFIDQSFVPEIAVVSPGTKVF